MLVFGFCILAFKSLAEPINWSIFFPEKFTSNKPATFISFLMRFKANKSALDKSPTILNKGSSLLKSTSTLLVNPRLGSSISNSPLNDFF